jgi:hypothetical protein
MSGKRFLSNENIDYLFSLMLDSKFNDEFSDTKSKRSRLLNKITNDLPRYQRDLLEDWILIAMAFDHLIEFERLDKKPLSDKKRILREGLHLDLLKLVEFIKSWMPNEDISLFLTLLLQLRPIPNLGQDFYEPGQVIASFKEYLNCLDLGHLDDSLANEIEFVVESLTSIENRLDMFDIDIHPIHNHMKMPKDTIQETSSIERLGDHLAFYNFQMPIQRIIGCDRDISEDFQWIRNPDKLIFNKKLEKPVDIDLESGSSIRIDIHYSFNIPRAILSSCVENIKKTTNNEFRKALTSTSASNVLKRMIEAVGLHPATIYLYNRKSLEDIRDQYKRLHYQLEVRLLNRFQDTYKHVLHSSPDEMGIVIDFYVFECACYSIMKRKGSEIQGTIAYEEIIEEINRCNSDLPFISEVERIVRPEETINYMRSMLNKSSKGGLITDIRNGFNRLIEKGIITRSEDSIDHSKIKLKDKFELTDYGMRIMASDYFIDQFIEFGSSKEIINE